MTSRRWQVALAGAVLLLVLGWLMLGRHDETPNTVPAIAAASPPSAVAAKRDDARATADRIVAALQARDGPALAALVHPDGVRLSPSAFVDVDADVRLTAADVAALWQDPQVRHWGDAEASGDPIELSGADYARRYIVDHDYSAATVSENAVANRGTTIDNAATIYPGATRIEYLRQGADATDWSALRLILVPVDGQWRLVGIVHDQWAP
jgi:hypothetical protein